MKKLYPLIFLLIVFHPGMKAQETYVLSLDEAIAFALENNYTVKNAKLDIDAAEKQKWEATSIGLPQIDGKIDYNYWLKQQVTFIPSEITGGPAGEFTPVIFGTKQNINGTVTLNQLICVFLLICLYPVYIGVRLRTHHDETTAQWR